MKQTKTKIGNFFLWKKKTKRNGEDSGLGI